MKKSSRRAEKPHRTSKGASRFRLTLRRKLMAGFLAVVVLVGLNGALTLRSQSGVEESVTDIVDVAFGIDMTAEETSVALLEARRAEKDYLLRYKDLGFEEARAKYVARVQDAVATIHSNMDSIRELAGEDPALSGLLAQADDVDSYATTYETAFLAMVDDLETRGFVETGIEGELRGAVHNIEEKVTEADQPILMVDMLTLRRHEKDYMLRGTDKYVTRLSEGVVQFKADVDASPVSAEVGDELKNLADEYETSFAALVAADAQVATRIEEFRSAAHNLEPVIEAVAEEGHALTESERVATQDALSSQRQSTLLIAFVIVALSLAIAYAIARMITRPVVDVANAAKALAENDLAKLRDAAQGLAAGDLTHEIAVTAEPVEVKTSDEVGDMARSFNDMIRRLQEAGESFGEMVVNLRAVVGQAQTAADVVSSSSGVLATSSEDSATSASEVATSIGGVAEGATSQAQIAEELSEAVERIVGEVEATTGAVAGVTDASGEAKERAETGRTQIEQAAKAMTEITASFADVTSSVTELGTNSEQVEEIVDLIRSIAEQTNLLALNAAIEAARAGDMGRGFAVVASEVKTLAEESTRSTEQIAEIVAQMRDSVVQTVTAMENGQGRVQEGSGVVASAGEAFSAIADSVNAISDQVSGVSDSAGRIAAATKAIDTGTQELVQVIENNSAASEEVAAASEEAAATSEEIGATAQELRESAQQLAETMAGFSINGEADVDAG
ncbi:MAG: methyl-accepting chemotaxis protein [Acidimicrobiia bacterium]|nr:methyl-accepting chemotaxis protein [Acidimicrobiia bacterium]